MFALVCVCVCYSQVPYFIPGNKSPDKIHKGHSAGPDRAQLGTFVTGLAVPGFAFIPRLQRGLLSPAHPGVLSSLPLCSLASKIPNKAGAGSTQNRHCKK